MGANGALWEQSLPATQAIRFNCKTESSFIASKLCSHRFQGSKVPARLPQGRSASIQDLPE
ncbi:hypothetical protein C1C98_21285 [Pseudomonas ogarae]|uniref:Uncharacterized protein n=1 Tax=Pseudomonas ogarae (strain DSM 112162 / CECT 30235 / F113) TaxID=1114970 RepID=A0ABM6R2V2_PSEO1|nr:hypothetical protein C1C98_21285 [Pseudomonas ogarae]